MKALEFLARDEQVKLKDLKLEKKRISENVDSTDFKQGKVVDKDV